MKKGTIGILSGLAGVAVGAIVAKNPKDKRKEHWQDMAEKHLNLFLLMNQWVKVKQEGKNLREYFVKNNYKSIAVYGMSYVGETLVEELRNSDIHIKYGIDKNAENIYSEINIVSPEEELEEVDAIVVTSITFFDEIEIMLKEKIDCPIVSLEDILYENV